MCRDVLQRFLRQEGLGRRCPAMLAPTGTAEKMSATVTGCKAPRASWEQERCPAMLFLPVVPCAAPRALPSVRSITLQLAQDPSSNNLGTTVWDASIVLAKYIEKASWWKYEARGRGGLVWGRCSAVAFGTRCSVACRPPPRCSSHATEQHAQRSGCAALT